MKRMGRVLAVVLVMVFVLSYGGRGYAANSPMAKRFKTDNEEMSETARRHLETVIAEYPAARKANKPLMVELVHRYYILVQATNKLSYPLSGYVLMGYGFNEYDAGISQGYLAIEEHELDKWKEYLNGEISGDEYVSFVKDRYATVLSAEDLVQMGSEDKNK